MSIVLRLAGCLQLTVHHSFLKNGIYWYQRRIPRDVASLYPRSQKVIRKSVKTRNPILAATRVAELAERDDLLWRDLRGGEPLAPSQTTAAAHALLGMLKLEAGQAATVGTSHGDQVARDEAWEALDDHLKGVCDHYAEGRERQGFEDVSWDAVKWQLGAVQREALRLLHQRPSAQLPTLSVVRDRYLGQHDSGQAKKFREDVTRAIEVVISSAGDRLVNTYTREHADSVVERLSAAGRRTSTVRRRLNTIVAVFNYAIEQMHLDFRNSFEKYKIKKEGKDAVRRVPFTNSELRAIAFACREKDDDIRHIVALLLDTGARLSEVVGLRTEDVVLDCEVPHLLIRVHEGLGRTLKTASSTRSIPLIANALWGAQRSAGDGRRGRWLFPRYASDNDIRATAASGALNKWIRESLGVSKTVHSFRHSLRDRLREAEVPDEIKDVIGGWGAKTVAQMYGSGASLLLVRKHLMKAMAL